MGYRKTKDVLAMANLLLNTRPDASSAEVMRKAASMLRDIAEERAHLTQPAQAVDVSDSDVVRALCRTFGDGYGAESEDMYLSPHNERLFDGMREALREFALNQAGAKIEYGSSVNPETLIREALTAAIPNANGKEDTDAAR